MFEIIISTAKELDKPKNTANHSNVNFKHPQESS